jgi:DNA-binding MurR/RpiR family transcriptional regulator
MRLADIVNEHRTALTDADRRLLQELMADPVLAPALSGSELAARADLHEAAATRLAQKLGFKGYPQFRAALRQDALAEKPAEARPAERVRHRLGALGRGDLLPGLIDNEIAALRSIGRYVNDAQLDRAARMIGAARHVHVYGRGHADSLVALLARRLRRFGQAATPLPAEGRDLADSLMTVGKGDLVIAVALRRVPKALSKLLRVARGREAATLLIADAVGPTVAPAPDLLLWAPRGSGEDFLTLGVPMLICNAIVLKIAQLDQRRSLAALRRLAQLIEEFE